MDMRASIRVVYDSKKATDGAELVDVATYEEVVVICDAPALATTDQELYFSMLKKVIPQLRGDTDHIWVIEIESNIPDFCFENGLRVNSEKAVFCFELSERDVFEKYLAHQLNISSKVETFDLTYICDDCLSQASHGCSDPSNATKAIQ